jgi:hypothetical protein
VSYNKSGFKNKKIVGGRLGQSREMGAPLKYSSPRLLSFLKILLLTTGRADRKAAAAAGPRTRVVVKPQLLASTSSSRSASPSCELSAAALARVAPSGPGPALSASARRSFTGKFPSRVTVDNFDQLVKTQ